MAALPYDYNPSEQNVHFTAWDTKNCRNRKKCLSGLNLWTLMQYQFISALIISNDHFPLKLRPEQATRKMQNIIPCALTGPLFGILFNSQWKAWLLFNFYSQYIMGTILMYVCIRIGLGGKEYIVLSRPATSLLTFSFRIALSSSLGRSTNKAKRQKWSTLCETFVAMKLPKQFSHCCLSFW